MSLARNRRVQFLFQDRLSENEYYGRRLLAPCRGVANSLEGLHMGDAAGSLFQILEQIDEDVLNQFLAYLARTFVSFANKDRVKQTRVPSLDGHKRLFQNLVTNLVLE